MGYNQAVLSKTALSGPFVNINSGLWPRDPPWALDGASAQAGRQGLNERKIADGDSNPDTGGGDGRCFLYSGRYPILLARTFRNSRPPVRKDLAFRPTVSILIAVQTENGM